ncbi:hypothetical protein DSAG12_02642 [Promethearchaeum syntrophicum]|uniref:Uncharacterized protein n=1 Tax=Promethearchaeum syntrophicum TaxID=2594042 RepID=A0A5B9DCH6_9ARCH
MLSDNRSPGSMTQSNYNTLKFLLNNKCKIDDGFKTMVATDYRKVHALYKTIYCIFCGHGFNIYQENLPINASKKWILCPNCNSEKHYEFKSIVED